LMKRSMPSSNLARFTSSTLGLGCGLCLVMAIHGYRML
jgi:hypothetical protein